MTDATGNDEAAGLGMLPLAAVCEAAGVNESLVATLYEEVVNEEPETVGFRAAVGLGEDIDAGHEDEDEGAEDRRQHVTVVDFLQKFPYYLVKPQKKKQNSKTVSSDQ